MTAFRSKILVVDDHDILREGVRSLLERQSGLEVVGQAGDGRTAIRLVQQLHPDVVVMDIAMPDLNGIDATHQIKQDSPATKVLILSMHKNVECVSDALKAGASGFLLKINVVNELVPAIHAALNNEFFFSPAITGLVVENYKRLQEDRSGVRQTLTSKEREALQLLAEGKSTKEVAAILGISVKAVEARRQTLMAKLKINSIAELTKFAIREGITSLD